jgi:SH3 domain-containing YSC84-like protein 1
MKLSSGFVLLAFFVACSTVAFSQKKETERLDEAAVVLKEILEAPDNVPQPLLDKAECVVVIPSVKKFAIGIGGSYGRGAMICRTGRTFTGPWGAPAMYRLEGANIGLQLGGQATDFLLLVMNPRGAGSLLKSKVKLGAELSAAAGPKGRAATAATDAAMRAEILAYSRSRGLFAGVSVEGSTLRQDNGANEKIYGRKITAKEIIYGRGRGGNLAAVLTKYSPRNLSDPKSLAQQK